MLPIIASVGSKLPQIMEGLQGAAKGAELGMGLKDILSQLGSVVPSPQNPADKVGVDNGGKQINF